MPGPGPHMMYALGTGTGLMRLSHGRFTPHHCLFYATNSFLGPDLGSFAEWLASFFPPTTFFRQIADFSIQIIHHPFYYILLLGFPLSFFYAWLSRLLLQRGLLYAVSPVGLSRKQCFCLVAAGSLSHFFLDHLFEENGHSSMYTWILSTGWWKGRAPINPYSVIIIGFLCTCLIAGFVYINRVKHGESIITNTNKSFRLIVAIASFYCIWCVIQIYFRNPPQAAVGEEADLGVLVFLAIYFFLPHAFCILSVSHKDYDNEKIPL